jgi:hypothetical protein
MKTFIFAPLLLLLALLAVLGSVGKASADPPRCRGTDGEFTQELGSWFRTADGGTMLCVNVGGQGQWLLLPPGFAASATPFPPTATATTTAVPPTPTARTPSSLNEDNREPRSLSKLLALAVGGVLGGLTVGSVVVGGGVMSVRASRSRRGRFVGHGGLGVFDLEEDLGPRRFWPRVVNVQMDEMLDEMGCERRNLASVIKLNGSVLLDVAPSDAGRLVINGNAVPAGQLSVHNGASITIDGDIGMTFEEDEDDDRSTN